MTAITFVGANAGVSGNYGNLTPTIHASAAANDAMLLYATCRNTAATVNTPAGWSVLLNAGHVVLLGRVHSGSESSPTVTFSGGALGDDVTAQIAVFRTLALTITGGAVGSISNGSAQNITLPAASTPSRNNSLLLVLGWKQDDWTSVATLAGMTEIAETFSIVGNDAGMVWDYQVQTTAAASPVGPLTVTGGASAVSKAWALALDQTAAITATEQAVYPPRVLVSVTNLVLGDSIAVYRVVSGERTLLRNGVSAGATDTSFLVVDAELPFGVPVSYVAVVEGIAEYATPNVTHTLPGGKVALSDAVSGLAAEVVIIAWPDKPYQRQASTFQVGGRNVALLGELAGFAGTIEVFVETTSSADNVWSLLRGATLGVIQIRQPGGYDGVDCYVAVMAPTERRFSQDGSDDRRRFVLNALQVEAWPDVLGSRGFTLQDIADAYTGLTLTNLNSDYVSLLAVALADWS